LTITGIATLYFLFDFINQVIPAALGPELRIAFKADAATFGLISSCYFYSYAESSLYLPQ
jgi:fucose permease